MDRFVTHASFTLERSYSAPPARVFAAWADPALDGKEEPAWRENGTADQLKALAAMLESTGLENTVLESDG